MSDPSMGNRDMVEDGTAHKGGAVSSAALNETSATSAMREATQDAKKATLSLDFSISVMGKFHSQSSSVTTISSAIFQIPLSVPPAPLPSVPLPVPSV